MAKYLRGGPLALTAATYFLAALVLSSSALMLASLRTSFEAYEAWSPGVVIVSREATTPLTGLLPQSAAEEIAQIPGVSVVSPEVVVPVYVNGRPAMARGVMLERFSEVSGLRVVRGRSFDGSSPYQALVGEGAARKLGISPGDVIVVRSVLRDVVAVLEVVGVFRTGTPVDDEVLTTLEAAQELRGTRGSVTLIRVVGGDPEVVVKRAAEIIAKHMRGAGGQAGGGVAPGGGGAASGGGGAPAPRPAAEFREQTEDVMRKYGYNEYSILLVLSVMAVALTVGIRYALAAVYEEHRDVIAVLWSLGMSERRLWLEMAARIAAAAVAASLAGYLAGYALLSVVYDLAVLRLLIHLSIPPPEPITPAAVAAYSAATAFMIRPKVGGGG